MNLSSLSSAQGTLSFLQVHGYWIMFILMIFEGPIVTAVAAFAADLGVFNIYLVFLLSFLGNVAGDLTAFAIGRFWRGVVAKKYGRLAGLKPSTIRKMEVFLRKSPGKTLTVIKITPPLPWPGLMLAGALKLPIRTFLFFSAVISALYSLFFTALGYYFGLASENFLLYLNRTEYLVIFVAVSVAIVYLIVSKVVPAVARRLEKI